MTTSWAALAQATLEHLGLTAAAVAMASAIGIPLAVYLFKQRFLAGPVLTIVGAAQTIPSLALLGMLIPLIGIGEKPALLALFVYALLPIVRATYSGLMALDPTTLEAARGIGMTDRQVLTKVALPLALPVVMGGVRTATVINVGVATLAALIGAGGLGTFIFRGISMVDTPLMLTGAIPAALMAIALDGLLGAAERRLSPTSRRQRAKPNVG